MSELQKQVTKRWKVPAKEELAPVSILIVEDDLSFAIELEMLVEEMGCHVAGVIDNSADALDFIFSESPDFILMDILIKGKMSGVDIGKSIAHLGIPILYITSFSDETYYQSAQASNLYGYLVKPVDRYTLRTTIDLSLTKLNQARGAGDEDHEDNEQQADYLFVRRNKVYEKLFLRDIVLIEGAVDYVRLWTTAHESVLLRSTMTAMEKILSGSGFYRLHRSYIVNLAAVQTIDFTNNKVSVLGRDVPFSRQKRGELESLIHGLG